MSILAHATYGAPRFDLEKHDLAKQAQQEIKEAKRLQKQTGCSWGDALSLVLKEKNHG